MGPAFTYCIGWQAGIVSRACVALCALGQCLGQCRYRALHPALVIRHSYVPTFLAQLAISHVIMLRDTKYIVLVLSSLT